MDLSRKDLPPSKGKVKGRRRGRVVSGRQAMLLQAMGKLERIKRRILREALLIGAMLVAMCIAAVLISEWNDSRTATRDKLQGLVNQLASQVSSLTRKLEKAEKSLPIFEKLMNTRQAGDSGLDRQMAKDTIQGMADTYMMTSMRISMSPVKDLEDPKYRNEFVIGQSCEIVMNVEAPSDEHVLAFIRALHDALPGSVKVLTLNMTRASTLTPQIIVALVQTGKVPLVKADIRIMWMGLKALPKPGAVIPQPPPGGR